ncbi:MAG: hypothetical protein AAF927_06165 [Bacteroidota bacterium]
MLRITTLFLAVGFMMTSTSLSAQKLLSSFPLKQAPLNDGLYFPYQDDQGCEHMLIYPDEHNLRVLYLDAEFQLLEDIRVWQETQWATGFQILSYIDQPEELLMMVQLSGFEDLNCLIYNKAERSLKRTELEIPLKFGALYSMPIVHEGGFLSLQIPRKGSEIVVHRTPDGHILQSDTFDVGLDRLKNFYELPQTNLLFPITAASGNSLFSNIATSKLYLYGPLLYLSIEDQKKKTTQLISINLDDKTQSTTEYRFPNPPNTIEAHSTTSLVYEDLILLASFEEGMGLALDVYELGFAEPSQHYDFPSNASMDDYFLEVEAERNDGESLRGTHDLHENLRKSLILSLEPTAEGDLWLIVGSIRQLSPEAQYALMMTTAITGAFLGVTLDPISLGNGIVTIAPNNGILSSADIILSISDRYGKFFYRVGSLRAQDLSFKPRVEIEAVQAQADESREMQTPYQKIGDFMVENRAYRPTSPSKIMFPYQNGIVMGFATRKRQMMLYYFE